MACVCHPGQTRSVPRAVASDASSVIGSFQRSRGHLFAQHLVALPTPASPSAWAESPARGAADWFQRGSWSQGGQAQALGCQQRSAAAVDARLRKDGRHMHTHRVFSPAPGRGRSPCWATAQQRQHVRLPRRERRRVGSAHRGAVAAVDRKTRLAGQRTADSPRCPRRLQTWAEIHLHHAHVLRESHRAPRWRTPARCAPWGQACRSPSSPLMPGNWMSSSTRSVSACCSAQASAIEPASRNAAHAGMVLHDQAQPRAEQGVVIHEQKDGSHTGKYCAQPGVAG